MLRWIGRFGVVKKRVQDAWVDLIPDFDIPNFNFDLVTSYRPTMNIAKDYSESRVPTEQNNDD